jgi:hypothetical protein
MDINDATGRKWKGRVIIANVEAGISSLNPARDINVCPYFSWLACDSIGPEMD